MIETHKLQLFPLDAHHLDMLLNDRMNFEKHTGYIYDGESLDGILYDIFSEKLKKVKRLPEEYFWHSIWVYAVKSEKMIVGSMACKNSPDENRDIEIGYGINLKYENKGYTTEAVNAFIGWILARESVDSVIAEVEKENTASQKVLQKCRMKKYQAINDNEWYRISK